MNTNNLECSQNEQSSNEVRSSGGSATALYLAGISIEQAGKFMQIAAQRFTPLMPSASKVHQNLQSKH